MDRVARDRLDTLVARVLVAMEGMERDAEPGAFTYRRDEAIALVGLDEKAVADRILHAPAPRTCCPSCRNASLRMPA